MIIFISATGTPEKRQPEATGRKWSSHKSNFEIVEMRAMFGYTCVESMSVLSTRTVNALINY